MHIDEMLKGYQDEIYVVDKQALFQKGEDERMRRKMEDVAGELQKEKEELFAFVRQKFIEIAEASGKPAPEKKLPKLHTKVMFFLSQKDFVKALLDIERRGKMERSSPVERHPQNVPYSHIGATTLIHKGQESKEEMLVYILVNCTRLRAEAGKKKMDLKECVTLFLIHELFHTFEDLTGVFFLRSTFIYEDGFTVPIYEAWKKEGQG